MGMLHDWEAFQEPECPFFNPSDLLCSVWLEERGGGMLEFVL